MQNNKKFIIYIFLFLVLTFFLFIPGTVGGDALSSYINTENLVKHFSLTIHPDIAAKYNLTAGSGRELEFNFKTGQPYIAYGILNSIAMLPFYLLGMLISTILPALPPDFIIKFCVNISGCFIGALTGVFLFLLLQKLGFDKKTNFLMVLIYSFCTISFNYTVSTFGESIIALLVIAAFYYVYDYKLTGKVSNLILSAALLGLTPMGKFSNAVLIIPFLVYLFNVGAGGRGGVTPPVRSRGIAIRNIAIYSIIFGIFIFILLWINYIKTGIFPSAGYAHAQSRMPSLGNIPAALAGFLISPERSVFLFNLPLVLSLIYFKNFFKNFKDEAVLVVFLFVINILTYGVFVFWHGGICWGPRYLVPVIPLLILPCAFVGTKGQGSGVKGQGTEDRNCSEQNTTKNKTGSRRALARAKTVLIVLILLSFIIQLNSVMFSWYKLDNVISTDKYFYSLKYSQIPRSFYVTGAYFYKKISGKDMYMAIDGKNLNISVLAKVSPWPLRVLKGRIISDSGEMIILNKKTMFAVYFFFTLFLVLYVFVINRLRGIIKDHKR